MNVIVPLGVRADYLNARKLTEFRNMKLPPHSLHDDYLARSEMWKTLRNYGRVCARELLVYPESNGAFKKGQDVVDAETGWVLPSFYVSKANEEREVFGLERTGLFVDPEDIREENGRVIVHPASIIVLYGLLQNSGFSAKVDEATRMPLRMSGKSVSPGDELRCLWRTKGAGVRPLARGVSSCSLERRFNHIFTDYLPNELFDVTGILEWDENRK
jgi:hypothetical protein